MRRALLAIVLLGCGKAPTVAVARHEDRGEPARAPVLALEVTIAGANATTWGQDAFDQVPRMTGSNHAGEARDVWSLRELAHTLVGPTARVVSITGGTTRSIAPADWADPTRTPILHTTRRGTLKFRWVDPQGTWAETEVKDVTRIDLAR